MNKRVRLVYEVEVSDQDIEAHGTAELAALVKMGLRLNQVDNEHGSLEDALSIYKEVKVLRPFSRQEGVTYGRRKGTKFRKYE